MKNNSIKVVNYLWVFLIVLTLFSAYMAESRSTGFISVTIMAIVLAIKGRLIVDYFMELKEVNVVLRRLMQAYFIVIPLLIVIVYLFPEQIAQWSKLD